MYYIFLKKNHDLKIKTKTHERRKRRTPNRKKRNRIMKKKNLKFKEEQCQKKE